MRNVLDPARLEPIGETHAFRVMAVPTVAMLPPPYTVGRGVFAFVLDAGAGSPELDICDGAEWQRVWPGGWSADAACSSDVGPLPTAWTDITGATLTLPKAGSYVVLGAFSVTCESAGANFEGALNVGGSRETSYAKAILEAPGALTLTQAWQVTAATDNVTAKLQAQRLGAGGDLTVKATHTVILASSSLASGGGGGGSYIEDSDADTKIQTEESGDEDRIRMDTGGVERAVLDSAAFALDTVPYEFVEIATPGNPVQNRLRLFVRANGDNIDLVARSSQGAEAVLASLSDVSAFTNKLTLNWIGS